MCFTPDLAAYFARIGDAGSRRPNLETLNRLIEAHVRTIPFENLDVLLGRGISVEPADIERKLVHEKRGGYCFEQNTLMMHVLLELGYAVRPISARVRIGQPRDVKTARTHMFLLVDLESEAWLVDVGVGGLSVTCALRLALNDSQPTPHESRRIIAAGDWTQLDQRSPGAVLYHEVLLDDSWQDVCEFTLEEMHPIDRELANWYTSTHPTSHFRDKLTVARSTATGRVTLLNRELKHRDSNGQAVVRRLESDEELIDALRQEFGLVFPAGTRFECGQT